DGSQAFAQEVPGRVDVSVVFRSTAGTSPTTVRELQGLPVATIAARLRGGEEAIDLNDPAIIPLSLVEEHPGKGAMGGIAETLGQLGFRQALEIQVFDAES